MFFLDGLLQHKQKVEIPPNKPQHQDFNINWVHTFNNTYMAKSRLLLSFQTQLNSLPMSTN